MTETDATLESAKAAAERLAGEPILSLCPLGAGANSRVFQVATRSGTHALKFYPQRPGDDRNRVDVEWKALTFLRTNHVHAVPHPLACDEDGGFMLMEWIHGAGVERHSQGDLEHAAQFIARVFSLSQAAEAQDFPPASESCLSAAEILSQIDERLQWLTGDPEVESFLAEELRPVLEFTRNRLASDAGVADILPTAQRRLIPADFGFHNALRESDGSLRYIDFDYFGWDDPVKLTADFILHPSMRLSDGERTSFVAQICAALPYDSDFHRRLAHHLPLYAIRWSLIVLNAFRRDRDSELPFSASERSALFTAQAEKARRFLARAGQGA